MVSLLSFAYVDHDERGIKNVGDLKPSPKPMSGHVLAQRQSIVQNIRARRFRFTTVTGPYF